MCGVVGNHDVVELLGLVGGRVAARGEEEGEDVIAAGADEEDGLGQQSIGHCRGDSRGDVGFMCSEVLDLLCHGYGGALEDEDGRRVRVGHHCRREKDDLMRGGGKLTVESRIPDPPEAKLTPRRPLRMSGWVLFTTARYGGGLLLNPI